jgi:hypothetical protein
VPDRAPEHPVEKITRKVTGHRQRRCDACGEDLVARSVVTALIPDSSVVDPRDSYRDGVRVVTVCSDEELHRLVADGHTAWSDEQLWMGRLRRASKVPYLEAAALGAIARRAGLNDGQLARLLDWNAGQAEPVAVLPGGQTIERTAPPGIADR